MDNMVINIIGYGIPVLIGLLLLSGWIIFCILKYRKWHHRFKNCTKRITVDVSDVLEKKTRRGSMVYKPIFTGIEDGREVVISSAFYSNLVSFGVGENLELLINPGNYQEFIYAEKSYNKGINADIFACVFIPVIFLVGILLICVVQ